LWISFSQRDSGLCYDVPMGLADTNFRVEIRPNIRPYVPIVSYRQTGKEITASTRSWQTEITNGEFWHTVFSGPLFSAHNVKHCGVKYL